MTSPENLMKLEKNKKGGYFVIMQTNIFKVKSLFRYYPCRDPYLGQCQNV